MKGIGAATAFLIAASSLFGGVAAIAKISRKGRYLYDESGERFYIKGIAYQEQGAVVAGDDNPFGEPSGFFDPLSNTDACKRDVQYLTQLGVNAVRVYSVNSSLNHDGCMQAFSSAGIYTLLDLALPGNASMDRNAPTWSTNLLDHYLRTIDAFEKYDNVLAVNVGNEVVTAEALTATPFIKAAARDVKAYLKSKKSSVLVGYSAIDGQTSFRVPLAEFFSCGSDADSIDLYGLNEYAWCGDSDYATSYANIDADYADYNVAAYFSEVGCITSPPRLWTEMEAIFSEPMSDHWSGAIAFSYFPAESVQGQFGMVTISDDEKTVTTSSDFDRLVEEYGKISPPNSPTSSSDNYPSCSSTLDGASTKLPGTPDDKGCSCIYDALACQFTPATNNYTVIVGELLNNACSMIGQSGGSCDILAADGATGTYGSLSGCSPEVKLSYIMSEYYAANNNDQQACSFAGNGTVNSASKSQASAVASSCLPSPSAVFTPTAPSAESSSGGGSSGGGSNGGSGSGSGSGSSDDGGDGALSILVDPRAVIGVFGLMAVGVVSGLWTLV